MVISTLLYGSETWAPLAGHMKHLKAFIMGRLYVILGMTSWGRKKNTELYTTGCLEKVQMMVMNVI